MTAYDTVFKRKAWKWFQPMAFGGDEIDIPASEHANPRQGRIFISILMCKTFGLSKANANVSTGFSESIILSFREHYSLWFFQSFCHRFEASSLRYWRNHRKLASWMGSRHAGRKDHNRIAKSSSKILHGSRSRPTWLGLSPRFRCLRCKQNSTRDSMPSCVQQNSPPRQSHWRLWYMVTSFGDCSTNFPPPVFGSRSMDFAPLVLATTRRIFAPPVFGDRSMVFASTVSTTVR